MTSTLHNICSNKNKMIKGLESLEDLKKIIFLKNKLKDMIIKKSIKDKWNDIQEVIKKAEEIIPMLKKTEIYDINDFKELISFLENNVSSKKIKKLDDFFSLLKKLLSIKKIDDNILLLKSIIKDTKKCNTMFSLKKNI